MKLELSKGDYLEIRSEDTTNDKYMLINLDINNQEVDFEISTGLWNSNFTYISLNKEEVQTLIDHLEELKNKML